MHVYNYVTVETEDHTYEDVVAVQNGAVLGIVPDPTSLERGYGRGGGQPERLFKRHARYVVPLRRVIEIDRGGEIPSRKPDPTDTRTPDPDPGRGDGATPAESAGARDPDDAETDDDPDDVFDEV